MLLALCCRAQQPHLFSSDYDLSSTLINEVVYDYYGNLWVATQDGLNRYDGSKFTIYRHIPGDSTSLSNNFVPTIFEDKDHNLLVATYHGLQVYDRATDSFTPLTEQHRDDPQNISVSSIAQSPDGKLLLGCHYLIKAHISDAGVIRVDELLHPDSVQNIHRLIATKDGDIWFLQDKKGVGRIAQDGSLRYYLHDSNAPIGRCFALGADGSLYLGTREHGLMRYDSKSDDFEWLTKESPKNLPIQSMYGEDDGTLLVGTDGNGMFRYDPASGKMISMADQLPFSRKYKVHSIKRDPYGNLWLGVFQKGLMMVPAHTNAFSLIGQRSEHPLLIGNACVTAVFHDADDNLWVGTDNDGMYRMNPDLTDSQHFYGGQYPEILTAIYQDSLKNIWVASYDKGLGLISKDGSYHDVPMRTKSGKRVQSAFDMQEDGKGGLWIATMGDGLFKYDYSTRTALPYEVNGEYNVWINALMKDPKSDRVYFGTYDGLFALDGRSIKRMLPQMIVSSIWIDDEGTVWAGTINGLAKVLPDGTSVLIDEVAGLPSVMVHAIEDDGQYLWISTNAGITRFDPKTNKMVNFTVQDGLQDNEFYRNASCRDDHGHIYFGGLNGISYFNPEEIQMVPTKATVRIIDFYVGAEPVKAGSLSNGRLITDRSVGETETFCLGPGEALFSVDFNMLEAYGSNEPVFAYSLDGADWQKMPRQKAPINGGHRLTFNKLSAGKHTLKLKAVGEGVECEEKVIFIDIAPMWYATWWAWIIWALIFCGIVYGCYMIYCQRKRQKLVEQEHQREAEIKEAKLQFFTNVSHEIKTPMTLVMSPVEQLMAKDSDPERQRSYRTILRNGKRILRLVNEIMDLRKIDNHQMRLSYTRMNLVEFLQDLYTTFIPAAEKKHIEFTFTHDGSDALEADFDLTNLDKVVMNLLSNAMKYTPDGGKVNLNLSTEEREGKHWIKIVVTDTGIGVPKEEREHIFERFYRVANNKASGTGIGLHLAYKLMQLHDGALTVGDNPEGAGSQFVAAFPKNTDAKVERNPEPRSMRSRSLNLNLSSKKRKRRNLSAVANLQPYLWWKMIQKSLIIWLSNLVKNTVLSNSRMARWL